MRQYALAGPLPCSIVAQAPPTTLPAPPSPPESTPAAEARRPQRKLAAMPPKVKRIMTQPIVSATGARRAASAPGAAHRASNGVQRGSGQLAFRRMASANVARPPAGVGALAAVLAAAAAAACCRSQVPLPGVLVCSWTAVDELQ